MKTKLLFSLVSLAAVSGFAAAPQCTNVTIAQPSAAVEVTFDLDQDAIVTFAFATNGAPVSPDCFIALSGDGLGFVRAGQGRKLVWKGWKDLPNARLENLSVKLTAWNPDVPPPYMVANLSKQGDVRYYASAADIPFGVGNVRYKTTHMVFSKIPAAGRNWSVGSNAGEESTVAREVPHQIRFADDYYMAIYECTGGQYSQFKTNPTKTATTHPYTADLDVTPVASCTMADVRGGDDFAAAPTESSVIGLMRTKTGLALDLPTHNEWEVAARAGIAGRINVLGATMDEIAWTTGNWKKDPKYTAGLYTINQTHEVGLLKPNAFGLYDVVGNVLELGRDWFDDSTYTADIGPGATAANVNDVVWPATVRTTVNSTSCGRFGGGYYESSTAKGMSPARWAGYGYNGQTDTGFRLMCPVANGGRL